MQYLLIMFGIVAILMFICRFVYKLIQDAHSSAENARRRATEKTTTEDLKNRYK